MTNPTTSTSTSTIHQNVIPSEVGWQFVPQYYTFVNKHPNRLHCFYTKASTFIHGTEGEDGKPCYGQQEIHNKITSIGFQDCKVFIHSVDAQSSANGGIIIQVIGEMSNRNDPWRKFVQTFFLAEQPNGYFVLNDIFRFLKEEAVDESDEGAPDSAPAPTEPVQSTAPQQDEPTPDPVAAAPEHVVEPTWSTVTAPYTPEPQPQQEIRAPSPPAPVAVPVEEPAPTPAPAPESPAPAPAEPAPKVNGTAEPQPESKPAPLPPVEKPATPPPTQPEPVVEESPAPPTAEPAPKPPTQAPAQQPPAPQVQPQQRAPAPPAAPSPAPAPAPPQPKTWANLAAANSKKWGSAVAQEVRGTSEVVAPAATPSPGPASGAQTPVSAPPRGGPPHQFQHGGAKGDHNNAANVLQSITTAGCFVKGVIEPLSQQTLQTALTTRFGPIKELEIVRSKACAFLEFQSIDAARKAIQASLPPSQGGEGGIRIDIGTDNPVRISVETRKERGERPVSNRGRGGGAVGNGERGGYGGYGEGRGDRGGFRGGRGGMRGRGAGSGGK